MDSFVLDCSATMACFLDDEPWENIEPLKARFKSSLIKVPSVWPAEVINVLARAVRRERLTESDADVILLALSRWNIAVDIDSGLDYWQRVTKIARNHGLSGYDATYLELALRYGIPLATFDNELIRSAENSSVGLVN